MCTVSWLTNAEEYLVFFNRDELKTRSRALPPSVKEKDGVHYIAPVDLDGGGTWLGVNEFGVTCGLLNNYSAKNYSAMNGLISRGLLVASLLDSRSLIDVLKKLETAAISAFKPFLLALFAPNAAVLLAVWDGESLRIQNEKVEMPISSSLFNTYQVVRHRQREFAKLQACNPRIDASFLESFHAGHSPEGGAYSVCMHREDAETVSFSRIRVTPDVVEFHYTPGAPCETAESEAMCWNRRILKNDP